MPNNKEEWMRHAIHWLLHDGDIPGEDYPDIIDVQKEDPNGSEIFYPNVRKVYKVGSRAEKTNVFPGSDSDYNFEISPPVFPLQPDRNFYLITEIKEIKDFLNVDIIPCFWFQKTEHEGFYQILDKEMKCIAPKVAQIEVSKSLINDGWRKIMHQTKPSVAVTSNREDYVICFRLGEWPTEFVEKLDDKLKWFKKKKDLTGINNIPVGKIAKKAVFRSAF